MVYSKQRRVIHIVLYETHAFAILVLEYTTVMIQLIDHSY